MRLRRHKAPPPDDEFLRALEERRAPAVEDGPEDFADQGSEGDVASVPGAPGEAEARAAQAEAALVQVREEADRRLADARAAIEREREERAALEQRFEQGQAELARQRAELETRERDLAAQLAQSERRATEDVGRMRDLSEEEQEVRERWERWEADAQREAERRAAELAEAERRIAGARAALDQARGVAQGEPGVAEPPEPAVAEAPVAAPAGGSRPRGRMRRLLGRRSPRPAACATCARAFDDAEADSWEAGPRGSAICPQCRAEGWHFADGALVPVRRVSQVR